RAYLAATAIPRKRSRPMSVIFHSIEHFDGSTYQPDLDGQRLTTQLERVRALMSDGQWRTLAEIGAVVPGTEASLSARLRDLRKRTKGAHSVERRRIIG